MNPSFRTSLNSLAFALVWIRLPAMPSALWTRYTLELIVQLDRHLIKVDQETELQSKVQLARVVVEVDLSRPLFPGANVDVEGEIPNFGKLLNTSTSICVLSALWSSWSPYTFMLSSLPCY